MNGESDGSFSTTEPSLKTRPPMVTSSSDELVITCLVDAPAERVFKAWTVPERLMRWWAPKGWLTPFCEVDPRPSGTFLYCMRSPDGQDVWGRGIFREVVERERLVYVDSFSNERGELVEPAHYGMASDFPSETLVTVTFSEQDGKTEVTVHHAVPESVSVRSAMGQGWSEMLDRLANDAAALGAETPEAPRAVGTMRVDLAGNETRFTRVIDAAPARVFKAWVESTQLARWWGPEGFTNPVCEVDARPGGTFRIVMRSPDGDEFPVTGTYQAIAEPERIVFTDRTNELPAEWRKQFNSYRGLEPDAPAVQLLVTVTFADLDGKTVLTIHTDHGSVIDRDAILRMGAAEGWAQSLDRLQAHLGMH